MYQGTTLVVPHEHLLKGGLSRCIGHWFLRVEKKARPPLAGPFC
jgi:hypothetical protein